MRKVSLAALVAMVAASAATAEGLPSKSKLGKLGLSSMQLASDAQGEQVRGRQFTKILFSWQSAAGPQVIVDPVTGMVSFDPINFLPADRNSGAGITEDGKPLNFLDAGVALPQLVNIMAQSSHQQSFVDANGNVAAEVSASMTSATVFAGDVISLMPLILVPPIL